MSGDDAYLLRAVSAELNRWGRWIERHLDYDGYPGVNILAAYIGGSGGKIMGHKILCPDMPPEIYAIHARVLRCSEAEQEALWIRYVPRVKPDGTLWTLSELCRKAGISEDTLRQRVNRAKRRILGIPFLGRDAS